MKFVRCQTLIIHPGNPKSNENGVLLTVWEISSAWSLMMLKTRNCFPVPSMTLS